MAPNNPKSSRRWLRVVLVVGGVLLVALVLATATINTVVYDDLPLPPYAAMEPLEGVGALSATQCGACHPEHLSEWRGSAHGQAAIDPLYLADRAHQSEPYFCDYCHAPLVEQRPELISGLYLAAPALIPRSSDNPRYGGEALHDEGVVCAACHQRGGAIHGPHENVDAPHPVVVDEDFKSEALCAPCHKLEFNFIGDFQRPIQDTFAEHARFKEAGGEETCVDCHMPAIDSPRAMAVGRPERAEGRSHTLRDTRDVEFLRVGVQKRALTLGIDARGVVSGRAVLFNGAGHNVPTAEPNRRVEVVLELLDPDDNVLADDRAVIQRVVDLATMTEAEGMDTSLPPRQAQTFTLEAPATTGATSARLRVVFYRWNTADPLLKAAGIDPKDMIFELYATRSTLEALGESQEANP